MATCDFPGGGSEPPTPSRSAHAPYKFTAVLASTYFQVVGWTYFYPHGDFLLRYIHVLAVIFFAANLTWSLVFSNSDQRKKIHPFISYCTMITQQVHLQK